MGMSRMLTKDQMVMLLQHDIVPAGGCTEPVCVALAAADAAAAVGGRPLSIDVIMSPHVYKNGMSAGIPQYDDVGLDHAAALGALMHSPEKGLDLLENVSPSDAASAVALVSGGKVEINVNRLEDGIYTKVSVTTDQGVGTTVIRGKKADIVQTKVNGTTVFEKPEKSFDEQETLVNLLTHMTIAQMRTLVDSASFDELSFVLEGAEINEELADYSVEHNTGIGIAQSLDHGVKSNLFGQDFVSRMMKKMTSALETWYSGCTHPVASSAGIATNGLAVMLPIIEVANEIKADDEKKAKALAFGNLINRYIQSYIGSYESLCGCAMSSSTASAAGITYLLGGTDEQIGYAIRNMTGTVPGILCDGGSIGCAFKIASGSSSALMSALIALDNVTLLASDGICADTPEQCIMNMARVGKLGARETDEEVVDIMMEKHTH